MCPRRNTAVSLLHGTYSLSKFNAEKMMYMFMSHHQNAGQNYNIKVANKSFRTWQS
jgi:hypothetical protein